jgi:hypothetical protein
MKKVLKPVDVKLRVFSFPLLLLISIAIAQIENNKLILKSKEVIFDGNLFNNDSLPSSSFRTDKWKIN